MNLDDNIVQILQKGMLLVFDNKGLIKNLESHGLLNLLKNNFNPDFDGNESFFFQSDIRGRIQIFNDQIYVTSSQQGEVFRLNCYDENVKTNLKFYFHQILKKNLIQF